MGDGRKTGMKKNRDLRIFITSLVAALCVAGFAIGFAEVDAQCRRIGFGDEKTLLYQITGKNFNLSCIATSICYNIFILYPGNCGM